MGDDVEATADAPGDGSVDGNGEVGADVVVETHRGRVEDDRHLDLDLLGQPLRDVVARLAVHRWAEALLDQVEVAVASGSTEVITDDERPIEEGEAAQHLGVDELHNAEQLLGSVLHWLTGEAEADGAALGEDLGPLGALGGEALQAQ